MSADSVNVLYHLPTVGARGFLDKLVNGWWTGSIISVQTGMPFSPLLSSDREQSGLASTSGGGLERPSFVTSANVGAVTAAAVAAGLTTCPANATGCIPYNPVVYNRKTVITHSVQQWFNPNMFALQPVGTIGDVGRNILTEPGLATWDFSLNKDTAWQLLGDAGKVQFRAEMFNLLNHPNFGPAKNGGVDTICPSFALVDDLVEAIMTIHRDDAQVRGVVYQNLERLKLLGPAQSATRKIHAKGTASVPELDPILTWVAISAINAAVHS